MTSFVNAKKTQVITQVINGVSVDMRIKWDAEYQEYAYAVKRSYQRNYSEIRTGYTNDFDDAVASVLANANQLVA